MIFLVLTIWIVAAAGCYYLFGSSISFLVKWYIGRMFSTQIKLWEARWQKQQHIQQILDHLAEIEIMLEDELKNRKNRHEG